MPTFANETMFITYRISKSCKDARGNSFTFWKSLSCLHSVLSQTLSLYFPHYSELEKTKETLPIFMSLRLKWLRRSWLGNGTVGGGRLGWARGLCWARAMLLGHGACFSELGAEAGLLSSAVGKPKRQRKSGLQHLIKGKRWPEMVPLPATDQGQFFWFYFLLAFKITA